MKKVFLLIVSILLIGTVMAQEEIIPVANSSFENWNDGSPEGWTTSIKGNILMDIFGTTIPVPMEAQFGEQTTDAYSGNSALLLKGKILGIPNTDYSISMPGLAQLGLAGEFNIPFDTLIHLINSITNFDPENFDPNNFNPNDFDFSNLFDLSFLEYLLPLISPGDTCSQTPVSMDMWIKYVSQAPDTMNIIAVTKQNRLPVGFGLYHSTQNYNEYTKISIPFLNKLSACDSIVVVVFSGGITNSANSELYIYDVVLNYHSEDEPDKVEDHVAEFKIYPNPASDKLTLNPAKPNNYDYQLMDLTGRIVCEGKDIHGVEKVSVSDLAPGIYMLRINQDQKTVSKKVIVQ